MSEITPKHFLNAGSKTPYLSGISAFDARGLTREAVARSKALGYELGQRKGVADELEKLLGKSPKMEIIRGKIYAAETLDAALEIVAHEVSLERSDLEAKRKDAAARIKKRTRDLQRLERVISAYDETKSWFENPLRLERANEAFLHHLCEQNLLISTTEHDWFPPEIKEAQAHGGGVFLIQHDWGALLASVEVDSGEIRLPYDRCSFEFEISGRHVCAIVACENGAPYRIIPVVRVKGGWLLECGYAISPDGLVPEGEYGEYHSRRLAELIHASIRAIAIALDVEVMVSTPVREPHLSNRAHAPHGHNGYSHHTLSLSRTHRVTRLDSPTSTGTTKRLHFRRGHWRHYQTHKTWIKWCLVGDPERGFAEKDYRL